MNNKKSEGGRWKPVSPVTKLRLPLWSALCLAGVAVGCGAAALWRGKSFTSACGDVLGMESLVLLALAWLGYLRKDGVRLLHPRPRESPAESWKDRIPGLGGAPLPSRPLPGPKGPEDPEYARLAEAEDRLRKRILGESGGGDRNGRERNGTEMPGPVGAAALAGIILLAAALCLEYLV
jgi:hypothetical protein